MGGACSSYCFYCSPHALISRLLAKRLHYVTPTEVKRILQNPVAQRDSLFHNWNGCDKALSIRVESRGGTAQVTTRPLEGQCSVVRGKIGYRSGLHVWRVDWPLCYRDKFSGIGVATKAASLNAEIGSNAHSWGWNLADNLIMDVNTDRTNHFMCCSDFLIPPTFYLILNMDEGVLAFMAYGKYLGTACSNLTQSPLYIAASTFNPFSQITIKYLGEGDSSTVSEL